MIKDGQDQTSRLFAYLFNNYSKFNPKQKEAINEQFKKLGIDPSSWLTSDGKVKKDFIERTKKLLLGEDPSFLDWSLSSEAEQLGIRPGQKDFSQKFVRHLLNRSIFSLLPPKEQRGILEAYVDSLGLEKSQSALIKKEIESTLRQFRRPPDLNRLVAQSAVLKGQDFERKARQLNERPRKTLDYETPAERFAACVASTS